MKKITKSVPIYNNVIIGHREKEVFVTFDGKEFDTQSQAFAHEQQCMLALDRENKEKIAFDKMHVKEFNFNNDSVYLLRTTTIEDLWTFEDKISNYYVHHLKEDSFKPNTWYVAIEPVDSDYRSYVLYVELDSLIDEFDIIMNYVRAVNQRLLQGD